VLSGGSILAMEKTCKKCGLKFIITDIDLAFLDKIAPVFNGKKEQIPPPNLCPDCRTQRRLSYRNEHFLYKRKCDLTGKEIVSQFAQDKPHKVYDQETWWSDKWDAMEYGQDFDFNRPFFEQFQELLLKTPLISNTVVNSVNCEYNSFCVDSKDCYLCSRVGNDEKCFYSALPIKSYKCFDCLIIFESQKCFECINCYNCYNCKYSEQSKTCSDCYLCFDCIGCKNCFGCVGLRNAEYYFFNKKYLKEEYEKLVKENWTGSHSKIQELIKKYEEHKSTFPVRHVFMLNAENATGDFITNSKDVHNSFGIEESETIIDSWGTEYSKDISNSNFIYYGEKCYENISNSQSTNILFTFTVLKGVHDVMYSIQCFNNTHDCFGCVSLKQKKYCILNKQYTKSEYEDMLPRIIEHMRTTGEWGEFFPMKLSPFGYNETLANDYFPCNKEDAIASGANWYDEKHVKDSEKSYEIPDNINDVDDEITKHTLKCEKSGKPYKIVNQELEFYRENLIPIPRLCPYERYRRRLNKRNPHKLWDRKCNKCGNNIKTSYSPERPEKVYCEKCYLETVY
jgi:hypothetical protein